MRLPAGRLPLKAGDGTTLRRLIPWLGGIAAVAACLVWAQRSGDFGHYVTVGELALAGRDVYRDSPPGMNTWPPLFSLLCAALAWIARPSVYAARLLWLTINGAALWLALRGVVALTYPGRTPDARGPVAAVPLASAAVLVPLILCLRFVIGNFEHLQVNVLIFAGTVAGLRRHARGDDLRGGCWLGCVAALKVMPALFIPYFLYRRRLRMAVASSVATVAFSLLPACVYGWQRFIDYLAAWWAALGRGWGVGKMNQSVLAVLDRWLGQPQPPWRLAPLNEIPASGDPAVLAAYGIVVAGVTTAALRTFRGREDPGSPASLAEYGTVLIVSALFGPVAWKAYLVVLLCPLMLLVALARDPDRPRVVRRASQLGLVVYALLAVGPGPGLVGKTLANRLEMLSFPSLGTLALLVALFRVRPHLAGPVSGDRGP